MEAQNLTPADSPCPMFQGRDQLVHRLDAAVRRADTKAITHAVQSALVELIRHQQLTLPSDLTRTSDDHYARHLVYRSEELGYTVVAMVWGPGQGTALHDHAGTWCVEGVLSGEISVTQYELLEHAGERWRFKQQDTICSHVGSAGSLIPPFEYHTIANARADGGASVTLHVYGREIDQCGIFEEQGNGWYQHRMRSLRYDN